MGLSPSTSFNNATKPYGLLEGSMASIRSVSSIFATVVSMYLVSLIVDLLFEKLFNSSSLHPDRQPFVPSGVQV
jgi:hypothetical protein